VICWVVDIGYSFGVSDGSMAAGWFRGKLLSLLGEKLLLGLAGGEYVAGVGIVVAGDVCEMLGWERTRPSTAPQTAGLGTAKYVPDPEVGRPPGESLRRVSGLSRFLLRNGCEP
jgi:hypothetical protein